MNRFQLDQVIELVEAAIGPNGFECIEAEWVANERVLRLYIDRLESQASQGSKDVDKDVDDHEASQVAQVGIDLEGCAMASRLLAESPELDAMIPGPYSLEVSSPGLERPLRRRRHFEKAVGATVQVKLQTKILDRKNGTGRLVGVNDNEVTLETTQGAWSFPIDQVQKASLVYSWDR